MRLQNEELAKRTMQASVEEMTAHNEHLTQEIESYKKQLESSKQERPKMSGADSIRSKEPVEEPKESLSVFGSIRKGFGIKRPKVESVFGLGSGGTDKEKDFQFTATGIEGHLKVPKDGRISKGWSRRYAIIKDYQLFILEKEKDREKYPFTDVAVDLRWTLFQCAEATESSVNAKKDEIMNAFTIHAKSTTPQAGVKAVDVRPPFSFFLFFYLQRRNDSSFLRILILGCPQPKSRPR